MPDVPTLDLTLQQFESALTDIVHATRSNAQARKTINAIRIQFRDFLRGLAPSLRSPEAVQKRQEIRVSANDQRWLAKNRPMIEDILSKLTTPPYSTLQNLADQYGLSRERIRQISERGARAVGIELPSRKTRGMARRKPREAVVKYPCAVCGHEMIRRATQYSDGNYYCAEHRYHHAPGFKEKHNAWVRANAARRRADDPAYAQRIREYHRQRYHQRKPVAC